MGTGKLKIFICITKSNWGGAQKYVFDIATGLPKDGFDVSVLLGGDGELKKRLDDAGIKTILLKNSQRDIDAKKEFGLLFELIKIFRKEKPDIIHLNSSKMGFTGALAGRIAGVKKIVFTGHGWAFNEDRAWMQKIFFRILHILTILLSETTIAVSQITKDQIGAPWNTKMIVIRNGIQPIDFQDKESARKTLAMKIEKTYPQAADILKKNPLWIGTISELHKTKGLNYAIEAIANIKENVTFAIIGEGEERENLQKLIHDLGVSDKVFLLGRIESAGTLLEAFDIFTLTSITEALPYALLEAGLAGLCVIASRVGGIPEIIEDGKTGILVRPKNAKEIKNVLENILANQQKIALFGQSLREKITEEFSIKNMLTKTIEVYKKQ